MKYLSWLIKLFFIASFFSSCAQFKYQLPELSPIDAKYRLKKIRTENSEMPLQSGETIPKFYKNILSPVLNTKCKWMPSDSEYAMHKVHSCGLIPGILKAVSRYNSEFDAYKIAEGFVNEHSESHFFDFDSSCKLF